MQNSNCNHAEIHSRQGNSNITLLEKTRLNLLNKILKQDERQVLAAHMKRKQENERIRQSIIIDLPVDFLRIEMYQKTKRQQRMKKNNVRDKFLSKKKVHFKDEQEMFSIIDQNIQKKVTTMVEVINKLNNSPSLYKTSPFNWCLNYNDNNNNNSVDYVPTEENRNVSDFNNAGDGVYVLLVLQSKKNDQPYLTNLIDQCKVDSNDQFDKQPSQRYYFSLSPTSNYINNSPNTLSDSFQSFSLPFTPDMNGGEYYDNLPKYTLSELNFKENGCPIGEKIVLEKKINEIVIDDKSNKKYYDDCTPSNNIKKIIDENVLHSRGSDSYVQNSLSHNGSFNKSVINVFSDNFSSKNMQNSTPALAQLSSAFSSPLIYSPKTSSSYGSDVNYSLKRKESSHRPTTISSTTTTASSQKSNNNELTTATNQTTTTLLYFPSEIKTDFEVVNDTDAASYTFFKSERGLEAKPMLKRFDKNGNVLQQQVVPAATATTMDNTASSIYTDFDLDSKTNRTTKLLTAESCTYKSGGRVLTRPNEVSVVQSESGLDMNNMDENVDFTAGMNLLLSMDRLAALFDRLPSLIRDDNRHQIKQLVYYISFVYCTVNQLKYISSDDDDKKDVKRLKSVCQMHLDRYMNLIQELTEHIILPDFDVSDMLKKSSYSIMNYASDRKLTIGLIFVTIRLTVDVYLKRYNKGGAKTIKSTTTTTNGGRKAERFYGEELNCNNPAYKTYKRYSFFNDLLDGDDIDKMDEFSKHSVFSGYVNKNYGIGLQQQQQQQNSSTVTGNDTHFQIASLSDANKCHYLLHLQPKLRKSRIPLSLNRIQTAGGTNDKKFDEYSTIDEDSESDFFLKSQAIYDKLKGDLKKLNWIKRYSSQ